MGTEQRSFRLRYLHPSFLSVPGPRTKHTPLRVSIWVCLTPPPWIQDALHHHHTVHRFRCHRTDLQHVTTHIRLEYTSCATWLNSFRMGWLNRLTRPLPKWLPSFVLRFLARELASHRWTMPDHAPNHVTMVVAQHHHLRATNCFRFAISGVWGLRRLRYRSGTVVQPR